MPEQDRYLRIFGSDCDGFVIECDGKTGERLADLMKSMAHHDEDTAILFVRSWFLLD